MVDPIGPKSIATDRRIGAIARAVSPRAANGATSQPLATPSTPTLAAQLAASPPVDVERVAKIKRAVAEGNFPLSPDTIADRLIAARYEWMSHDPA